ncbi:NADPH-dependent FMN reductase [Rhodococcus sp. NPDC060176]|uniref:NADPH-dependent FMN reductase n=1 Tax=Rhodococcus sp. NPDC060176 TaxID=3347062 RepID=UPI0036512BED
MNNCLLQIVIGSTRPGRAGSAVATWVRNLAIAHGGFAVELVDLADVDLPLLDEPNHPRAGRYTHAHTIRWSETVQRADAFIFVVPEYNHGYNAATKNALDFLCKEWHGKPIGFVGYGGAAAGARAIHSLIPVVSSLGMLPAARSVNIPIIARALGDDGTLTTNPRLDRSADDLLDELAAHLFADRSEAAV